MWDQIIGQLPVVSRRKTVKLNADKTSAIIARNRILQDSLIKRQTKINELTLDLYNLNRSYKNNATALNQLYAQNWELEERLAQLKAENEYQAVPKPRNFWQRLVYLFRGN